MLKLQKLFARITSALVSAATAVTLLLSSQSFLLCPKNVNRNDVLSRVQPETWALTDGLGRTAPVRGEVKAKDNSRFVGLFYWTWHTEQSEGKTARNVSEILQAYPEALRDFSHPAWQGLPSGYPHFWNEPIYGYYKDTDAYVLRKQAELIADAGVDVIFFDCTNGTHLWESSYEKLFKVFASARRDGVRVPQVAFMLPFGNAEDTHTDLVNLYQKIYKKGRYRGLWFFWDGKPLVMANPDCLDKNSALDQKILSLFTFRAGEPSYFAADTAYQEKRWGWCSDYPQTKFGVRGNSVEQMCVSVAQNAADGALVAMNADAAVQGRAFAKDGYTYKYQTAGKTVTVSAETPDAVNYGLNFQQQWDYAIAQDPHFIFVTGWNEWIAGRWNTWQGTENAFPDQCSDRFSRDCEPSKGVLKDHYYCQLVQNIRRFKGISAETATIGGVKIYHHYTNSTLPRNADGWGDLHYESDTLRNDFEKVTVHSDVRCITMRIYTKENVSPRTDNAWMRVLIDVDPQNRAPHWEGFEYIVNRKNATKSTVLIERSCGGWNFEIVGSARYAVSGRVMTLKIPVSALGLKKDNVHFRFKLSDNMQTDGDIMDFYLHGDVAPGGRFTFVY